MFDTLIASGYAFLKSINENETVLENKFTGLRVVFNTSRNSYKVIEE